MTENSNEPLYWEGDAVDWNEEQWDRVVREIIRRREHNPFKELQSDWQPSTGPRLYPRPVKGISGNTVYYVFRVDEYTPLFAFLYDTVDLRDESADKNIGRLRVQCVFAENAELRPKDLEYIRSEHNGCLIYSPKRTRNIMTTTG